MQFVLIDRLIQEEGVYVFKLMRETQITVFLLDI